MSGLTHEHRNGRTFSVRQWREVRADNAAALMSYYGLGRTRQQRITVQGASGWLSVSPSLQLNRRGGGEVRGKRVSDHSSRPPRDHHLIHDIMPIYGGQSDSRRPRVPHAPKIH